MNAALPAVDVQVQVPWDQAPSAEGSLAFRFADTAHGVRVDLAPNERSLWAGARPVVAGAPVPSDRPLVGVPRVDLEVDRVEVRSEGHDLIVRFYGPPLDEVSDHPDAPQDPVHTWARLRPRNGSWRVVSTGLVRWDLPGRDVRSADQGWSVHGEHGVYEVQSDAPAAATWWWQGGQELHTWPSLNEVDPYPKVGVTWRLDAPESGAATP